MSIHPQDEKGKTSQKNPWTWNGRGWGEGGADLGFPKSLSASGEERMVF